MEVSYGLPEDIAFCPYETQDSWLKGLLDTS